MNTLATQLYLMPLLYFIVLSLTCSFATTHFMIRSKRSSLFAKVLTWSVLLLFAFSQILLSSPLVAEAATYTFAQTSWAGGVSGSTLSAPTTSSTYYASQSNMVLAANSATLATTNNTFTQTTDTDFNAGTYSSTAVSGTGDGASVKLTTQQQVGSPTTFSYTGSVQSFTVPAGVVALGITANGAGGGNGYNQGASVTGAAGGSSTGSLAVTPGTLYYVLVGGNGGNGSSGVGGTAGYGGGGVGGGDSSGWGAGGGGGMTWFSTYNTFAGGTPILVAGGGGGGGDYPPGGAGNGGGSVGGNGTGASTVAYGGTQSAGGVRGTGTYSNGVSGSSGIGGNGGVGGGGGGGYYGGGGGGGSSFNSGGGGGGSGYISSSLNSATTTQGGGAAAATNGSLTLTAYGYNSSGTFTSSAINVGGYASGTFSWASTLNSQTLTMKARSGSDANMTGATDWASCSAITSGSALSADSCIHAGDTYIQYQATLSTTNTAQTPSLDSVTIATTAYASTGSVISQPFNTGDANNQIGEVNWTLSTTTQTFSYTGNVQSFTVPAEVTSITINANGAGGGNADGAHYGVAGGAGGSSNGMLSVTPGTTYHILVGGTGSYGASGYGGGGDAPSYAAGGGGMTWFSTYNTFVGGAPILVAGGGGGGSAGGIHTTGATGGGTTGNTANTASDGTVLGGGGGTQSAGGAGGFSAWFGTAGSSGIGGAGGNFNKSYGGGGGGGGYYGGGGGGMSISASTGGGGGSGYLGSSLTSATTTQGTGAAAGANGSLTITYLNPNNTTLSLRTAPDLTSLSSATWYDFTATSTGCSLAGTTVTCTNAAMPPAFSSNAQYWQYKVTETSTGANTPIVSSVGVKYVINAAPVFQSSTLPVSVAQGSTGTAGNVTVQFSAKDPDADTDTAIGGHATSTATPSYQYSLDNGATWHAASTFVTSNPTADITLSQSSYSATSTVTWNAKADVGPVYTTNALFAVALSDHQLSNGTSTATTSAFTLDTTAPVTNALSMNVSDGTATFNLSDNSNFSYRISGTTFATTTSTSTLPFLSVGGTSTSSNSYPITFTSSSSPMLYLETQDIYGNDTFQTISGPSIPSGFVAKDISNRNTGIYQVYLSWATSTIANFLRYDIYRSTGGSYTQLTTIAASTTIAYADVGLSPTTAYYYKIRTEDTNGNISSFTNPVFITPTGAGGGPAISSVSASPADTTAVVTWNTNILPASSYVYYSQSSNMAAPISIVAATADSGPPYLNTATLTGLTSDTTYYYYVQSTDAQGNTTIDSNNGSYYSFQATNTYPPTISSVQVTPAQNSVDIRWTTNKPANSAVHYGISAGGETLTASSTVNMTTSPESLLTNLTASTTYYYYLTSIDSYDRVATTSESLVTTSQLGPVISGTMLSGLTKSGATVSWTTTSDSDSNLFYSTATTSVSFTGIQSATMTTSHALSMTGLTASTTYYYYVRSTDQYGNVATDKNGGLYYSFTTPADTTPPQISSVLTPTLGQTVATITWNTDKPSTSQVWYGTASTVYTASTALSDTLVSQHSASISGLSSGIPYYFVAVSTDQYGNTATSTEQTFSTLVMPGPHISSVATSSVSDFGATVSWQTNADSDSHVYYGTGTTTFTTSAGSTSLIGGSAPFTHSVALSSLSPGTTYYFYVQSTDQNSNATVDKNSGLYYSFTTTNASPPSLSSIQATNITAATADISWATDKMSDSEVWYGTTTGIYPSSVSLLGVSLMVTSHTLPLSGLTASTTYYYKVQSSDTAGNTATSTERSFTTLAPVGPHITDIATSALADTSATITWQTDTDANSRVYYSTATSSFSMIAGSTSLIGGSVPFVHSVALTGLTASTTYYYYIQSTDAYGTVSTDTNNDSYYSFATTNTARPVVSSIAVVVNDQTTAGITWSTDKPTNSQVIYGTASGVYASSTAVTDTGLVTSPHAIALSGLTPATQYFFIASSSDAAGNVGTSTESTFTTLSLNGPQISSVSAIAEDVDATVTWNTSVDANGFVFYGTATTSLDTSAGSSALTGATTTPVAHSVTLSGLTPGTTYYYYVQSANASGDLSADRNGGAYYSFTTGASEPPSISGIHTTLTTGDTIGIAWTTNKMTSSSIAYGTSTGAYNQTVASSTVSLDHQLFLTDLTAATTYYYVIVATDAAGNRATSSEQTAATAQPVFSNVTASSITDLYAIITWTTSIDSNSFVRYFDPTSGSASAMLIAGTSTPVGGSAPFTHTVMVTGLTPGTTYYYEVESIGTDDLIHEDNNNNHYYYFTTTDHLPPVISNVATPVIAATSTIVTWTTNKPSTSIVDYGTSAGVYASSTTLDLTSVTNHAITLSDLTASTTYYYRVRSSSALDTEGTSGEYSFTTAETPGTVTNTVYIITGGGGGGTVSFAPDTTPPVISNVASTTKPFEATVTFSTNEPAIGFVEYGTTTAYTQTVSDAKLFSDHAITLSGLVMGTPYHFAIQAVDGAGNSATTSDALFTTEYLTEASLSATSTFVTAYQFQKELENSIASALPSLVPPFLGTPTTTDITDSGATVKWTTNIDSYSVVYYAPESSYAPNSTTPYSGQSSNVTTKTSAHALALTGLSAGTTYHAMAESFSLPGVFGKSSDFTFTTKSVPVVPNVSNVGTTTFRVAWTTTSPTNSIVQYRDLATGITQTILDNAQTTFHNIGIENVAPAHKYEVSVSGYTADGVLVSSADTSLVTTRADIAKPTISNVKIQTIIDPQAPTIAEAIVNWQTDKPANSVVSYNQGMASSSSSFNSTIQDTGSFISNHVVIIPGLTPGALYQAQISSTDQSGNKSVFPVQTFIVSAQSQSVLDVLLNNFEKTFQFLQRGQ